MPFRFIRLCYAVAFQFHNQQIFLNLKLLISLDSMANILFKDGYQNYFQSWYIMWLGCWIISVQVVENLNGLIFFSYYKLIHKPTLLWKCWQKTWDSRVRDKGPSHWWCSKQHKLHTCIGFPFPLSLTGAMQSSLGQCCRQ